ncbi:hypothetical protein [Hymenobacter metallilatus]|uniref:Uncharacterized protein n=1 Tax=Hymenobacter metallilatus TaxID=2493666 RepID=A0A428JRA5_9BACT|nr:hypothetical protein [Hymenobacter metallilatus]RSK36150.1 hypothetical protein EI290_04500 [Hymenobacter metallilatus]
MQHSYLYLGLTTEFIFRFSKVLSVVAACTSLVPAGLGIRRWPQLTPALRYVAWFALVPGAVLSIGAEIGRWVFHYNLAILAAVTLGEVLLLAGAYARTLHSDRLRRGLGAATGLFVVVWCVELGLSLRRNEPVNNYTHILQTIISIGLAFSYFEQLLRELPNIRLERDPMFLVSVGACLYYTGSITIFVLEPYMQARAAAFQIWTMYIIQSALYILLNGFLALALYYHGRTDGQQQQVR